MAGIFSMAGLAHPPEDEGPADLALQATGPVPLPRTPAPAGDPHWPPPFLLYLGNAPDDLAAKTRAAGAQLSQVPDTSAGLALDRLREQLTDATRRIADAPTTAVAEYAAATNELFDDCSRSYQKLAGQADGHAADVRTLTEAWPAALTSTEDRR